MPVTPLPEIVRPSTPPAVEPLLSAVPLVWITSLPAPSRRDDTPWMPVALMPSARSCRLSNVPVTSVPLITRPLAPLPVRVSPDANTLPLTLDETVVTAPRSLAPVPSLRSIEMVSPTLAPTWKAAVPKEPSRIWRPLKVVCCATRVISARRCCTSESSAARSLSELVALADCTANWRMACRLSVICCSAAEAVWASDTASLALRAAVSRPLIWVVMRVEIAKPAASSAELLMRRPEDRRCIAVANELCDRFRLFCAVSDMMLVLMTWDMRGSPDDTGMPDSRLGLFRRYP